MGGGEGRTEKEESEHRTSNAQRPTSNEGPKDHETTRHEAAIVLGTAMQYNIAEVVDPLVHVVARIPKKTLNSLK
jgi:acetamidase/formamidase